MKTKTVMVRRTRDGNHENVEMTLVERYGSKVILRDAQGHEYGFSVVTGAEDMNGHSYTSHTIIDVATVRA